MDESSALRGSTLLLGPSNVGKTKRTATLLERWTATHGGRGVVVLDFAPEVVRADGTVLGGRITRFATPPDDGWTGILDSYAPRASAPTAADALELARRNAENARRLLDAAPEPTALFVNDATIPFQHPTAETAPLLELIETADCAVLNAFESTELGRDGPVSRTEANTRRILRDAVRRVRRLG